LINRAVRITRGEQSIALLGVDDYHNGYPDIANLAAQMQTSDYAILLSHSPDFLPIALATPDRNGHTGWVDLALCGHTHGGQITLFGYPLISRSQYGTRYLSGWKREENTDLLISNGIGVSYVPFRIG
ncbi:MAG: metallophosphoesterase, partial [Clostridia bacterium]